MAPQLRERRGGNGPVNQLENKRTHHERLLSLMRTAGNAANWPVASRRSFWSRDPQAPHPLHWPALESSSSVCMLRFKRDWFYSLLPLRRLFQHSTVHKNYETNVAVQRRKLSLIFRAASGRSDRYLPRCRERGVGWEHTTGTLFISHQQRQMQHTKVTLHSLHTGVTLWGSPPPHTCTHPAPARNTRLSLVPPVDTGGARILLGGNPVLTTAYPSSRRQIYIKSSSIPAGEGPCFLSSSRGEARRRGEAGTR